MGLLKAFGAAATSLGSSLQQAGALKHKEDLLEEQRNWEWKKMEWLADKESTAATTASRIDAYKTIMDQVGKEIKSIDETLGGAPNINFAGYDKVYLNTRRKALGDLMIRADALLMQKSGISQGEIDNFFSGVEKIAKTKPGDEPPVTEKEKESLKKNAGEGFDFGAFFDKWKPKEFWEDAPGKIALIGESIRNIAWENDILLNAVKKYGKEVGKVFIPSEDSEIRKTIASVLEGDESIANAKSAEDIKNIIKDKGLLKSIVSKIMSAFESDAKEEWEGTRFEGMTPGEVEEILNQETEQVGMIDGSPTGTLTQADKSKIDSEMQTAYDVGDETVADLQLPSDPKYLDSPSMHPDRDVVDTPRGETLETPPGTGEPHDVNYVEGRKAGTTNITSMTVGEIAEQFGYNTQVGMGALNYNEIIDLAHKYFYPNMSKEEARKLIDSAGFTEQLQKSLLYFSLGED
jgi:hypothetical protein